MYTRLQSKPTLIVLYAFECIGTVPVKYCIILYEFIYICGSQTMYTRLQSKPTLIVLYAYICGGCMFIVFLHILIIKSSIVTVRDGGGDG